MITREFKFTIQSKPKDVNIPSYKHRHNYSVAHITLLDSFGDYFDLYWDDDSQNYFKGRQDPVIFSISKKCSHPKLMYKQNR